MSYFPPPRFSVEQTQRSRECIAVCKTAIAEAVRDAVAAGWREQEVALYLADAAEDYVVYLATRPTKEWIAANSN
jgi:formaldehyde-activating enzyme involved in methanogenesis